LPILATVDGEGRRQRQAWMEESAVTNVEDTLKELLLELLDVKEEDITLTARFVDDLKATSIDMIEIISILQNIFDVDIKDSEVVHLRTVQNAVDLLNAAMARGETKD